jgi:hypothetical protein
VSFRKFFFSKFGRFETNVTSTSQDSDTLVVGQSFPGHDIHTETQLTALTGRTSPWNTLALWSLDKLAITGFLPLAEGLVPGCGAAFEVCFTYQPPFAC